MDYGVTKSWTELSDFHFTLLHFSHPYMTTGKTIALSRWTFVGKVTSLLFNTLSRFIIAFLPRSKHLLISWLQSLSAVILKPMKIRFVTVSTFSPSICHEVMGPDAMILHESKSHSVVSNSLQPHGLYSPWNSPGQNTGVGSLSLLQGIFPTQG